MVNIYSNLEEVFDSDIIEDLKDLLDDTVSDFISEHDIDDYVTVIGDGYISIDDDKEYLEDDLEELLNEVFDDFMEEAARCADEFDIGE